MLPKGEGHTMALLIIGWICLSGIYGQEAPSSRQCYDCMYQASSGDYAPCKGRITAYGHSALGVEASSCETRCFTKVEKNGDVRRGCYDGTYGIDHTKLGCHLQGYHQELYCFCDGDLCNGDPPPEYVGVVKGGAVQPVAPQSIQHLQSSPRQAPNTYYTEVLPVRGKAATVYNTPINTANNQVRKPPPYQTPQQSHRNRNTYTNKIRESSKVGIQQQHDSYTNNRDAARTVVRPLPKVYETSYGGAPSSVTHQQRAYHNQNYDNNEHNVVAQTSKEYATNEDNYQRSDGPGAGDYRLRQNTGDHIVREYVDHIARQRETKSRDQLGGKDQIEADFPSVEHRQAQHFQTINVGDRTIEHHIVEHYVLHHRIREKLKNTHNLDLSNVDPRQVSLIYRLLHPRKAGEIDAILAKARAQGE